MLLSEELGSARGYGAYSNTSRCCCDSQGLGLHMVMRGGGLGEAQTGGEGRMGVRAGWEGAPALRARLPGWDRAPGPAAAAAAAATLPTLFPNTHRASEPPSHGPSGRRLGSCPAGFGGQHFLAQGDQMRLQRSINE
ncbi:uncharacterized protein isoform X2 [Macaca fascicularis]|uniref:uncharacterized protein isoform X2 n=1 Tax=Macaca fascicularis TaxID=9541 RepID=UPI0032B0382F